jgi:hypothetical protein
MKKKIATKLYDINQLLLMALWGFSITLTFFLLSIFGWKINHPYNKKKERTYRKQIDMICHIIVCIWCLVGLSSLVLFGPFYTLFYSAQNIVYIVLTLMTMTIWLGRKYTTDQKSRNLIVVVSVWNLFVYIMTLSQWIATTRMRIHC